MQCRYLNVLVGFRLELIVECNRNDNIVTITSICTTQNAIFVAFCETPDKYFWL